MGDRWVRRERLRLPGEGGGAEALRQPITVHHADLLANGDDSRLDQNNKLCLKSGRLDFVNILIVFFFFK